jgi:acetate CoA/acetoacetate CoA-transferase alpha subunit
MITGETEVELCPQGTLAERIRAAGYGLGGVLTATGIGTTAAEKARKIEVESKTFLLELPISADFAPLAAHRADYSGNLDYMLTARNFNPIMALAGTTVIAEAIEIMPIGVISPDEVVTPCVLVDPLVGMDKVNGQ